MRPVKFFRNVKVCGEAASADVKAAKTDPEILRKIKKKVVIRDKRFITWMKLDYFGKKCPLDPTFPEKKRQWQDSKQRKTG
jgi:hypothetical protein